MKTLPFPEPKFVETTKFLVYADITYVREYHDTTDDSLGFFLPTKKDYRNETVLIGIVDHESDVEHVMVKPIPTNRFDWQIQQKRVYAKSISHFSAGE